MSMLSNLELIRRVPLFALLTATQAESVADAVVKRRFKRGEVVVEQGEGFAFVHLDVQFRRADGVVLQKAAAHQATHRVRQHDERPRQLQLVHPRQKRVEIGQIGRGLRHVAAQPPVEIAIGAPLATPVENGAGKPERIELVHINLADPRHRQGT